MSMTLHFPGYDALFMLEDTNATQYYSGTLNPDRRMRGTYFLTPEANAIAAGATATKPVPVYHYRGNRPSDVIWMFEPLIMLLAERVARPLKQFSGWQPYAVNLHDRSGRRISGYVGFAVMGRCGPADPRKMSPVLDLREFPSFVSYRGYPVAPESWDGSDVFIAGESAHRIVTAKVAHSIRDLKVKNVRLTPLTDYRTSEVMWRFLTREKAKSDDSDGLASG